MDLIFCVNPINRKNIVSFKSNKLRSYCNAEILDQHCLCSHAYSTATHLLCSIYKNRLSALQVYIRNLLKTHLHTWYCLLLKQLYFLFYHHQTQSIHVPPTPRPRFENTFTYNRSISKTQRLPHVSGSQRKSIKSDAVGAQYSDLSLPASKEATTITSKNNIGSIIPPWKVTSVWEL